MTDTMIGHNQPPATAGLAEGNRDLVEEARRIAAVAMPFACTDEATAVRLATVVRDARALDETKDGRKRSAVEPHRKAADEIAGWFETAALPALDAAARAATILKEYVTGKVEEGRRSGATAKATELGRVMDGAKAVVTVSDKGNDVAITDPALVPAQYHRPSLDAIKAAIAGGVHDIPGIKITPRYTVTIR